jgi:hypothetical protein
VDVLLRTDDKPSLFHAAVCFVSKVLPMIRHRFLSMPGRGACAVTLVLAAALSPVLADAATADSPEAVYQRERADCQAGRTQQNLKDCLYEAVSARDASRKGLLTTESAQTLSDNAQQRCQAQAAGPDRVACERMVDGAGTVSGSVAAGGELHELTTVVPAKRMPKRAKSADRAASSAP